MSHVKYLGVVFNKKVTRRMHVEMIKVKAFEIFPRVHSIFES